MKDTKNLLALTSVFSAVLILSCGNPTDGKNEATTADADSLPSTTAQTSSPQSSDTTPMVPNNASAQGMSKEVNAGELSITKVSANEDILRIEATLRNADKKFSTTRIEASDIFYVDDATSKKHSLLQDDGSKVMLSPLNKTHDKLEIVGNKEITIISMSFPAPPNKSETISMHMGEFGSFDKLKVNYE